MSSDCKIIMSLLEDYIKLKEDYKEYNKENLYDVFEIFSNELFELSEIAYKIDKDLDNIIRYEFRCIDDNDVKETINESEEKLINEIADVLLTTARLIKTFNLEEPLIEMMEYKYERQVGRELKRIKNVKK